MRLLVLAITFSLMMSNAAFAASEEAAAECDMDIEVELLAIQNKEKRARLSKNKPDLPVEEQKSIMTDAEHQKIIDEGKKKESSVDPALPGWH
jgi:hypothetical protein